MNVTVTTMNPTYRPEEIARQMENSETKYVLLVRNTGLPTKDETSETIVRNLFSPFSCIQGYL